MYCLLVPASEHRQTAAVADLPLPQPEGRKKYNAQSPNYNFVVCLLGFFSRWDPLVGGPSALNPLTPVLILKG